MRKNRIYIDPEEVTMTSSGKWKFRVVSFFVVLAIILIVAELTGATDSGVELIGSAIYSLFYGG